MAYATCTDVEKRLHRELSTKETEVCITLLDDSAIVIDNYNSNASDDAKKTVSCRMVIRAIGNREDTVPIGATQGTMSALGYSQSWTMSNGSVGELYLSKQDKMFLGVNNSIGSHSPLEDL